jgi:YD repeat-containing protein
LNSAGALLHPHRLRYGGRGDTGNGVMAATVTDGSVTYEYDNIGTGGAYAKGRLTKVTDPSGNTAYGYDALGRVTSKTQTVTASPSNKAANAMGGMW